MFIFYFLGVGLPCCSIFCQFWLCEEAPCVYLRRHLGSLVGEFLLPAGLLVFTTPTLQVLWSSKVKFVSLSVLLG